jgi:hypothetical protein
LELSGTTLYATTIRTKEKIFSLTIVTTLVTFAPAQRDGMQAIDNNGRVVVLLWENNWSRVELSSLVTIQGGLVNRKLR